MTMCLRTSTRFPDRLAFFRRVAGYTRVKFVFDFDPRTHDRASSSSDLRESRLRATSSCARSSCRSGSRCRGLAFAALAALEHAGPLARAALHVRGIWFVRRYPGSSQGGT